MKLRCGFVSNSSSSSFAVVAEKEAFLKCIEELTPMQRAVVEQIGWESVKFVGTEVIVYSHITGNYSTLECIDRADDILRRAKELGAPEEDIEKGNEYWDAPYQTEGALRKLPKEMVVMIEEDF